VVIGKEETERGDKKTTWWLVATMGYPLLKLIGAVEGRRKCGREALTGLFPAQWLFCEAMNNRRRGGGAITGATSWEFVAVVPKRHLHFVCILIWFLPLVFVMIIWPGSL